MTQLSDDVAKLQTVATSVETAITDLSDEITGLKAQIANNQPVTAADLSGIEQVISDLTAAATADPGAPPAPPAPPAP